MVFAVEAGVIRELKRRGSDHANDALGHGVAGMVAGLVQCTVSCPTELVKIKLQLERGQAKPLYSGPWECAQHIQRHFGWSGLYRGWWITVARDTPAFAGYFFTYHHMKVWFAQRQHAQALDERAAATMAERPPGSTVAASMLTSPEPEHLDMDVGPFAYLISGGVAGFVSWATLHPIDVLKSCKQMQSTDPRAAESSLLHIAKRSYAAEGWRFFFRGYIPTILRSFPVSAVTFLVYEWTLMLLPGGLHAPGPDSQKEW